MTMPRVGETFGRYRIESRLGYGGMGVVFAASDTVLERRVVLKVINEQFADQPGFVARFQREAVVLARLDSPHVITVMDSGTIDGHPFHGHAIGRGR